MAFITYLFCYRRYTVLLCQLKVLYRLEITCSFQGINPCKQDLSYMYKWTFFFSTMTETTPEPVIKNTLLKKVKKTLHSSLHFFQFLRKK